MQRREPRIDSEGEDEPFPSFERKRKPTRFHAAGPELKGDVKLCDSGSQMRTVSHHTPRDPQINSTLTSRANSRLPVLPAVTGIVSQLPGHRGSYSRDEIFAMLGQPNRPRPKRLTGPVPHYTQRPIPQIYHPPEKITVTPWPPTDPSLIKYPRFEHYPLYESEPDVLLPVPGLRVLEKEKSVPVRGSFVEIPMPEDVSPWVKKTFGAIHHFVPGPELLPTSVSYNLSVNRPQRFERDAEELKREKAAKKKAKAANKATKVAKAAAESREEEQEAEEEEAEEQAEGEQEVTQLASSTPMPRPSQTASIDWTTITAPELAQVEVFIDNPDRYDGSAADDHDERLATNAFFALRQLDKGKDDYQTYTLHPKEMSESGLHGVINQGRRSWIFEAREMYGPESTATLDEKRAFANEWATWQTEIEAFEISDPAMINISFLEQCRAGNPTSLVYALKVLDNVKNLVMPESRFPKVKDEYTFCSKYLSEYHIPSRQAFKGIRAAIGYSGPVIFLFGDKMCSVCARVTEKDGYQGLLRARVAKKVVKARSLGGIRLPCAQPTDPIAGPDGTYAVQKKGACAGCKALSITKECSAWDIVSQTVAVHDKTSELAMYINTQKDQDAAVAYAKTFFEFRQRQSMSVTTARGRPAPAFAFDEAKFLRARSLPEEAPVGFMIGSGSGRAGTMAERNDLEEDDDTAATSRVAGQSKRKATSSGIRISKVSKTGDVPMGVGRTTEAGGSKGTGDDVN